MPSAVATNAAASALSGIRAASQKLEKASANVAAASEPTGDHVTISEQARTASQGDAEAGLTSAMVDLRVARYQNAASVAVLRTSDDMTRDALRIGKPESAR